MPAEAGRGGVSMAYDLNNVNFLVVDENPHMRKLVFTILRPFGVDTLSEAADGASALTMISVSHVDILITDWLTGGMDGLEFMRQIRKGFDCPNPYLPVILMTAHSEKQRVMAARDSGVTEFLAKPISAKSLSERIESIIERPRPFVQTKTYFGPERRRHNWSDYVGQERRGSDQERDGAAPSTEEVARLVEKM